MIKKMVFSIIIFLGFIASPYIALAAKPPWAGEDWNPSNPPAAPEPLAMTLIGMGGSAAVGYYLGRKRRK